MTSFYWHPVYRQRREDWIRYRNLHTGNREALTSPEYLWSHALEQKSGDDARALRASRVKRTRYMNIPEIVVSLLLAYLFAKPPKLDEAGQRLLEGAEDNIDGKRNSWVSFLRDEFTKCYLVYGKAAILTDAFALEVKSRAEEMEKGARPFWELLEPLEIVDWSEETADPKRMGAFNWIRQEIELVADRESPEQEPASWRYSIARAWNAGVYSVTKHRTKIDNTTVGKYANAAGEVGASGYQQVGDIAQVGMSELPIAMIEDDSWIKDVTEETLRHYNLRSARDNILHYQGYQKIFVKGISGNDSAALKALAEYVISLLPENGDAFAIDSVDTSALERAEREALENALKVGLNQLSAKPADSKEMASAEATYAERINTTHLLSSTIEELEHAANKALAHYAEFAGKPGGHIEFNRELGEPELETILVLYNSLKNELGKYPEVEKEMVKKVLYKLFDEEKAQDLEKKIDATKLANPAQDRAALMGTLLGNARPRPDNTTDQTNREVS